MSTQKVTDLTALASADDDDVLLISDVSESASKKITVANLVNSKVTTAVSNLVDSAPAALDTLNELAAALGDDASFATTVTTSIGTKWTQDNTKISNWDTAYGWGDHSTEGYLTSFTETDPIVGAITGIVKADGAGNISAATAGTDYLTDSSTNTLTNKSGNISQWTNDSGYLTSFTETDPIVGAITGIVKADGAGNISAATAGTDYVATETDPIVGAITGIVKADGVGNISAATVGTDYLTDSSTNTLTNKSGNISQWTNDSGYLTSFTETNDLSTAVTWANIPDANVPQSAVTQHQAALSITESQISDLGTYLEEGFSVTAGTLTTANITTADFGNYTITETSGELLFATGGNTKMKLDTSGGFTIS